jgi:hypothetical protein
VLIQGTGGVAINGLLIAKASGAAGRSFSFNNLHSSSLDIGFAHFTPLQTQLSKSQD